MMAVPNDTLDFLCEHHRVYIVDDGLVSGTMRLRCQDCPREIAKDVGPAVRRPTPKTLEMWCKEERILRPHRRVRRSRFGMSRWACEACGAERTRVTPA